MRAVTITISHPDGSMTTLRSGHPAVAQFLAELETLAQKWGPTVLQLLAILAATGALAPKPQT